MVRHVAQVAFESSLEETVVVVGHESEAVAETLTGLPVSTVYNSEYAAGQSTSVRCGISVGRDAGWDAAVVLLGDMPFVGVDTVERLLDAYRSGAGPIVAPRFEGQRGNPVLFDRSQFTQLLDVSGDRGGRALVREHPGTVLLDTDDPGVVRDIDATSDLGEMRNAPRDE